MKWLAGGSEKAFFTWQDNVNQLRFGTIAGDIAMWADNTDGRGVIIKGTTGNVGVGTTTPSNRLEVNGNAYVSGTLTAGTTMVIPSTGSQTPSANGQIAIDTSAGQFKWNDGVKLQAITGSTSPAFNLASTTLDAFGKSMNTGTSTFLLANFPEARTLQGFYCKATSTSASINLRFGDGSNWTPAVSCSTAGGFTQTTSNNTFTAFEDLIVQASSTNAATSRVTITLVMNITPN